MSRFTQLKSHYQQAKDFYFQYERLLMPATLVFGFIVDYITFTNINVNTAFTILIIYWCGAGLTILFIHLYDEGKISERFKFFRLFSPLLLQFFFGALLGGSFIFYWFSGTFSASWPFILLLVILMISNDVFRQYFLKPVLQVGVYFFISFSLASVILPFIFNSLSPWLFIAAGVLSTTVIYGYIALLKRVSVAVQAKTVSIWISVIVILGVMNLFYFTSVIPPIPLSIREAGIYHDIQRAGTNYILSGEQENIFQKIIPGQTLHINPNNRVYAYSAIFAPARLTTTIYHRWEYHKAQTDIWATRDVLSFSILGGRNAGYRGYTFKSNLEPGSWRVTVETRRGQVLGRIKFNVKYAQQPPRLYERVR